LATQTSAADLVRQVREQLGLTQEKFAARLGVSFPTVNRWENGRAEPSPLALQALKDLLQSMGSGGQDLLDQHFPERGNGASSM
jgi:putative transcriptional regulator